MAEKLTTYDPATTLVNEEGIAIFMAEAYQTNDAAYIAHALDVVARAKAGPGWQANKQEEGGIIIREEKP